MADKRKLQGEMDRCYKKIAEGVETFEDIWQKLYNANNTNQKDKYENDLKKEIKKLQRLRDQIKTWAASNEIKDKTPLYENRRLIEMQMERFKVVERETKTKAFSKEGLVAATKVDPAQKEREETVQWLRKTIDSINQQVDMFESEIETTSSYSRKKKLDRDKQERVDELNNFVEKHRFHIRNLETLLRMLDNETIQPEKINVIRDDIEYYLEACQDPDYEDNEFIYEDMGLDESLANSMVTSAASPGEKQLNSSSNTNSVDEDLRQNDSNHSNSNHSSSRDDDQRKRNKSEEVSPRKSVSSNQSQRSNSLKSQTPLPTQKHSKSSLPVNSQPYAAAAANNLTNHSVPSTNTHITSAESTPSTTKSSHVTDTTIAWPMTNHTSEPSTAEVQNAVNSIVSSVESLSLALSHNDSDASAKTVNSVAKSDNTPTIVASSPEVATPIPSSTTLDGNRLLGGLQNGTQQQSLFTNLGSIKSIADQSTTSSLNTNTSSTFVPSDLTSVVSASTDLTSLSAVVQQQNLGQQMAIGGGESRIQPLLGVAPLGPVSLNKDNMYQQGMLEACWRHMPHPSDSERLRHYLPRNPCPTPSYYPQIPLPHHDSIEFYLRLSTEALFFIFYYMEATKAQYMAAKALKKQSWRFHTKYMMWFQRHEEPKTITDEYEQGTYIYFDYEKWGQRKKEGFTFEYRYLEDRELQ